MSPGLHSNNDRNLTGSGGEGECGQLGLARNAKAQASSAHVHTGLALNLGFHMEKRKKKKKAEAWQKFKNYIYLFLTNCKLFCSRNKFLFLNASLISS